MTSEMALKTMRAQSWQRVLGELRALSVTYWNQEVAYDLFQAACDDFIAKVEDTGILE